MTRAGWILLAAAASAGCDDLGEFATRPGVDEYGGCVVGEQEPSFIRNGVIEPGTAMRMQFDPEIALTRGSDLPLSAEREGVPVFAAALRPITALSHDALSGYDFPGAGRVRNYVFVATPDAGPLAGRDLAVFVSLMENEEVEVRLLGGRVTADGDEQFALFRLARQAAGAPIQCTRAP